MGDYDVTLIVRNANGCADTLVRPNYIRIRKPGVRIAKTPILSCFPIPDTLRAFTTSGEPIASWNWNVGEGLFTSTDSTPVVSMQPGQYNIKISVVTENGCVDTLTVVRGLRVGTMPVPLFVGSPLDICAKDSTRFQSNSTGVSNITLYTWTFSDGSSAGGPNPVVFFQDTGWISVKLVVQNYGCKDSLTKSNYVHVKPPKAKFAKFVECDDVYFWTFKDSSIGATQWHWDFGDGTTSTVRNPTHTYAALGHYPVKLTVANPQSGCTDTFIDTAFVIINNPNFTAAATNICRSTPAQFTMTNVPPNDVDSVFWDFGDGSTGLGITTSHLYDTNGVYTIKLILTNKIGCKDTVIKNNYIKVQGPYANFGLLNPASCIGSSVTFTDSSQSDGVHPIVNWQFDYGDTTVINYTQGPFTHSYYYPDVYTIQLVTTDSQGCTDSMTRTQYLTISQVIADFNLDSASCPNRSIHFDNESIGLGVTSVWTSTDGYSSPINSPSHTFPGVGTYDVRLVATDQYGCKDTAQKTIHIVSPTATMSISDSISYCPPLLVNFTPNATGFESLKWVFGNGNSSTLLNPVHTYFVPGIYTATLTVVGFGGTCFATDEKEVKIYGPFGTFNFAPLEGCKPLNVAFNANFNPGLQVIWDFNDGTVLPPTSQQNINHIYTDIGEYRPKMILIDNNTGCQVPYEADTTVKVFGVQAGFIVDRNILCDSGMVAFTETSVTNDIITGLTWNFGDGQTSTDANPQHFYTQPGLYDISLTTTTQRNCNSTVTFNDVIRVVASPQIANISFPNGCVAHSVNYSAGLAVPDTSQVAWSWDFGNGDIRNVQNPGVINYSLPGVYNSVLTVTNSTGCKDTAHYSITAYGLPNVSLGPDFYICRGNDSVLTPTGAQSYVFDNNPTLSCTNCNNPTINPLADNYYIVTGTDQQSCVNKDTVFVRVIQPFTASIAPSTVRICQGQSVTISGTGGVYYTWTSQPGGAVFNTTSITIAPMDTTLFIATITDSLGCFTVVDSSVVNVVTNPSIDLGPDQQILVGQTLTINPTLSSDVTNVIWEPNPSIISYPYPGITVQPVYETIYQATAFNQFTCQAVDHIKVTVVCIDNNFFIPNSFSPNNDGVNDVFYPRGIGLFRVNYIKIFDRWGELVFARDNFNANDPGVGWDGTYKGVRLNTDTYVYIAEVICQNGEIIKTKGSISLIR